MSDYTPSPKPEEFSSESLTLTLKQLRNGDWNYNCCNVEWAQGTKDRQAAIRAAIAELKSITDQLEKQLVPQGS